MVNGTKFIDKLRDHTSIFTWSELEEFKTNTGKKFGMFLAVKGMSMIPAFVYHEFCHLIAIWILGLKYEINNFFVFKYMKDRKKFNYYTLSISIYYDSQFVMSFAMVTIAPLIGYLLGVASISVAYVFSLFNEMYEVSLVFATVLLYMFCFYKAFGLSEIDKKSFGNMISKLNKL